MEPTLRAGRKRRPSVGGEESGLPACPWPFFLPVTLCRFTPVSAGLPGLHEGRAQNSPVRMPFSDPQGVIKQEPWPATSNSIPQVLEHTAGQTLCLPGPASPHVHPQSSCPALEILPTPVLWGGHIYDSNAVFHITPQHILK